MNISKENNLHNEWKLLLLLSRRLPGKSALDEAQRLIDASIKWDLFESLALRHETAPLIWKHFEKLHGIPEEKIRKFKGIYNNTLFSNILNISEMEKVVEVLHLAGVKAIPLKGSLASEKIFGNVGVYPASDIDILVPPRDMDRATAELEAMGYKLIDNDFKRYRSYYLKEQYHITFSNGKHAIELHWNLLVRFFSAPPDFWWLDHEKEIAKSKEHYLLSPEKELLYLAFRLFSKGFFSLKFLLLFAETCNYYSDKVDWKKLRTMAGSFQMEKVLTFACLMANELLKTPFPEDLLNIEGVKNKVLYHYGKNLLFKGEDPQPVKKIPLLFMRDDLKGALLILLRRIFPPAAEVAKRYQLSPSTSFITLYYLANPFILMLNRHKNRKKEST